MQKMMQLVLLWLLLANSAAAEQQCDGTRMCTLFADWAPITAIVILISLFVVSLAFMVGRGLGMRDIEMFAKEELYQCIASALILGVFISFAALLENTSQSLAGDILVAGTQGTTFGTPITMRWEYTGDGSIRWRTTSALTRERCGANDPFPDKKCHFYLARAFLGSAFEKLSGQAREVAKLYGLSILFDTTSVSLGLNIFGPVFGLGFGMPIFGGNSLLYETLETIFSVMTKMMLLLKFQEISLMYIERGIFPGLMIAGLVFRSIWFMRKLGGLLLALAIGLYTILPFMYVLSWYTMDAAQARYDVSALVTALENKQSATQAVMEERGPRVGVTTFFHNEYGVFFTHYRSDGSVEYYGMLDLAGRYALIAMATPIIALFVLLGFVRELSGFLGGDIEIAGLTRIL